jgi:hypothetical protein
VKVYLLRPGMCSLSTAVSLKLYSAIVCDYVFYLVLSKPGKLLTMEMTGGLMAVTWLLLEVSI